ncbi:MAG: efflux RND transporter periplasmic adaptor subunit [Firmicutes bacterium]|nr:efflux RND transporter periplasmic adaptor subunit [Bacillota bacterium]
MKAKLKYIIGGAVAVILIAGVFAFVISNQKTGNGLAVTTVKAAMVSRDGGASYNGKLEAQASANVVSKVAGKVGSVSVDVGSQVREGDVMVTLEANELAASVAQAQATLAVARSSRESALIDYEIQKSSYARGKELFEQKIISPADFDSRYDQPFKKAEENALNLTEAQVRQAGAALQLAQANYANSIITSPIDGVVTARSINPGELASTSAVIVSVANLDKVYAVVTVGEEVINKLQEGSQVPVMVAAVADQPIAGTITNIAQAISSTTKGYQVKILLENPDHHLKPGMFCEVKLGVGVNQMEMTVPKTAVFSEDGKDFVWVVNGATAHKQEVVLGLVDPVKAVIRNGLTEGQEVVATGADTLKEGSSVSQQ